MNTRYIVLSTAMFLCCAVCIFLGGKLMHTNSPSISYKLNSKTLENVSNLVPVAVIGSGVAGLSAALFAAREQYHTVLFEGPQPGGMLSETTVVENWPGIVREKGNVITKTLEQQIKNFGCIVISESVERVDFSRWPYRLFTNTGKEVQAMTVIVATGSWPRKLGIHGEDTYWGNGVTICTDCDAPLTHGQNVVVVGSGDTALRHTIHLLPHAKHITIVTKDKSFKAPAKLLNQVMQKIEEQPGKITILFNHQPIDIKGDKKAMSSVVVKNRANNGITELPATWVFLGIGYEPNSRIFSGILHRDSAGVIQVAPYTQATSLPGVYAAGKVANARYKIGAIASGEGIKAGLDAISFLEQHGYDADALKAFEGKFLHVPCAPCAGTPSEKTLIDTSGSAIKSISSRTELDTIISNTNKVILLEFFSPSCGHCQKMAPKVNDLANELASDSDAPAIIVKSDANFSGDLVQEFGVKGLPTFIVLKNGNEVGRMTGGRSKSELMNLIQKAQ